MKTYNVGDQVWHAVFEHRQVNKTCPVCFGKCYVTLILGNQDHVTLACDYCGRGYEAPKGTVEEYEYFAAPVLRTITRINMEINQNGDKREYYSESDGHCYILASEDIFDNKEDALLLAHKKAAEYEENIAVNGDLRKKLSNKSYSWKAGYWRREAKRSKKDAERYERYAFICSSKSRKSEVDEIY